MDQCIRSNMNGETYIDSHSQSNFYDPIQFINKILKTNDNYDKLAKNIHIYEYNTDKMAKTTNLSENRIFLTPQYHNNKTINSVTSDKTNVNHHNNGVYQTNNTINVNNDSQLLISDNIDNKKSDAITKTSIKKKTKLKPNARELSSAAHPVNNNDINMDNVLRRFIEQASLDKNRAIPNSLITKNEIDQAKFICNDKTIQSDCKQNHEGNINESKIPNQKFDLIVNNIENTQKNTKSMLLTQGENSLNHLAFNTNTIGCSKCSANILKSSNNEVELRLHCVLWVEHAARMEPKWAAKRSLSIFGYTTESEYHLSRIITTKNTVQLNSYVYVILSWLEQRNKFMGLLDTPLTPINVTEERDVKKQNTDIESDQSTNKYYRTFVTTYADKYDCPMDIIMRSMQLECSENTKNKIQAVDKTPKDNHKCELYGILSNNVNTLTEMLSKLRLDYEGFYVRLAGYVQDQLTSTLMCLSQPSTIKKDRLDDINEKSKLIQLLIGNGNQLPGK